ncbi:MAG TPA: energy transducer TonB [Pyrinomonadaceae bacterium]
MNRPRLFIKTLLLTALVACLFSVSFGAGNQAYAQQSETQALYDTAKRHYEAGAYRNALDTIEELLKSDSDYAPAFLLKSKALVGLFVKTPPPPFNEINSPDARRERKIRQATLLKEAADSLERFLQLKPDVEGAEGLRERLGSLRVYAEPATKAEEEWTVISPADATEKAHITRRPEPRYTEEARADRLSGTVKLLIVLAADAMVKHILVLRSSHPLLSESAIEAARKIRFEPAIKDGRPVSTSASVEYNFLTY